jgi:hypothetical protein
MAASVAVGTGCVARDRVAAGVAPPTGAAVGCDALGRLPAVAAPPVWPEPLDGVLWDAGTLALPQAASIPIIETNIAKRTEMIRVIDLLQMARYLMRVVYCVPPTV